MHLDYRPDIDGMRAIAVAIVVAFHAGVPLLEADLLDDLRWLLHEGGGRQQANEPRGLHAEHLAVRAAEVSRAGEAGADAGLSEAGALLH